MTLDIANSNVNRNITLAGTSVAIFTFLLFFLYPRSGEINSILFQFTLANCFSNLLPSNFRFILLWDRSYADSSAGAGNDHFRKGGSLLARRLQPTVAGAKLDSVYREPDRCRAVWTSSLVLLPVPYLAPV